MNCVHLRHNINLSKSKIKSKSKKNVAILENQVMLPFALNDLVEQERKKKKSIRAYSSQIPLNKLILFDFSLSGI